MGTVRRVWTQKPPLGAGARGPLADGLIGVMLFREGGGLSTLANPRTHDRATLTASTSWEQGTTGSALKFDGSAASVDAVAAIAASITPNEITMIVRGVWRNSAASGDIIDIRCADGSEVEIGSPAANQCRLIHFLVGGAAVSATVTMAVGDLFSFALTASKSRNEALFYQNGRALVAAQAVAGTTAQAPTRVSLGVDNFAQFWAGNIELVYIYNRALAPAEVQALHVTPYRIYQAPRRGLSYAPPASGTTFSDSRAETLSAAGTQDASVVYGPTSAFLVIAGIVVPVLEGHAVERSEWKGESYRALAGNLRTMVRPELLAWQVTTGLLTLTEAIALKAAVAFGAHVACGGVGLPGTVTCEVTVGDGAYINSSAADGSGLLRSLVLTLRQVS